MPEPPTHMVVIGAGVVGATFAWQLAEAGHRVEAIACSTSYAACTEAHVAKREETLPNP